MMNFRDRVLDRRQEFDERSRAFAAVDLVEEPTFKSRTWFCDTYNDQGREGACVGFAWSHELAARPKPYPTDDDFAKRIYYRAQELDQWPGENYSGTSVLAGVKAVQEMKTLSGLPLIREYRWAFGIKDLLKVLAWRGPAVLGIDWYDNMYDPDSDGFIYPTGDIVGGHAIMAKGVRIVRKNADLKFPVDWDNVDLDKSWVRLHNSWGRYYGLDGDAKIYAADLEQLLLDGGEACIPTLRSLY